MPSIIIVEKVGSIKQVSIKSVVEADLYKKAGLKSADGFKCYTNWSVEHATRQYTISLYGKTTGRANYENKYEFPPPVDNTLFFGNCILIAKSVEGAIVDLTQDMWEKIYETLYGGFEDIGEEDSDSGCDSEAEEVGKRTKNGYVKDGFVVDDDDDEEDDDDDDEENEEDEDEDGYIPPAKKESKPKKTGSAKIKNAFELQNVQEDNYLDCTSELSEESYLD
uniref:Uncharacterized protein n=1 Tax=viral metagenome TaxID=1070528 RepID=A0A6C0HGV7_9ZZZZ